MSGTAGFGWMPPGSPSRIQIGADFVKDYTPPDWLIEGIVQRGRLYACTSRTGHGKTAVWLFNACMIQAGRMVSNLDVTQGNVLILAGENPEDLKARMLGMAREYNLRASDLPYVLPGSFGMDENELERLKAEIGATGLDFALIIGDTAASFFPGEDENDNVAAGSYARRLRELTECPGRPAVMVLSHPIKKAVMDDMVPRGGGAFLNELDANLTLWSEVRGQTTRLHWHGKIRGPDFQPLYYELRPVPTGFTDRRGEPEMTVAALPLDEASVANQVRQLRANEDAVLKQLQAEPFKSFSNIARDAGWVDAAGRPNKNAVQACIDELKTIKFVEQLRPGMGYRLTTNGEKYLAGTL
jgi:hypothetical protein